MTQGVGMAGGPVRTVPGVLQRLGSAFSEFNEAFNLGEYVLWIGSGISRERVPNVAELVERILEHLRSNVHFGEADCDYREALNDVLKLANLGSNESVSIDFSIPVSSWPLRNRIVTTLIGNYSSVLDVLVGDDNPDDYLVWTALNVPETYGSPDLQPDVEHYCIAILMLEGLVSTAVTANWDGLLEKALGELTSSFESLVRVAVRPEDFRVNGPRMDVVKFHGCAVRARDDSDEYRERLIARESQISQWTVLPQNQSMRRHLEGLYSDRLTLMLGLSAQDANLHTIFASAIQNLSRPWPASPPPVVLSEEQLERHHSHVLRITFGANYQGNARPIGQSALLGSYGKPTLLALVLSSLTEKLSFLLEDEIDGLWGSAGVKELRSDLLNFRDFVARHADYEDPAKTSYQDVLEFQRVFMSQLIDVVNLVLTVFRTGHPHTDRGRYEPLSDRPVAQAILNADFPSRQFGRLSIALALIGRGLSAGQWSVAPGDCEAPSDGVLSLLATARNARLFFVKDATALTQLEMKGLFDESDGDVLIVVADEEPPRQRRSPKVRFGRNGDARAGRFNVAANTAETTSVDELYEAFKLAGGF